jgi:glutamate-1-semialdehyde 2,1-aminomutase
LRHDFAQVGDQLACFIVEPFLGGGGLVPASSEYLSLARELCQQHGVLLVFDEVISGFRFRAGDLGALYGLQPDLATFGKVIGGGMPVAAVAGRGEILGLAGRAGGRRVKFAGGTYSAHPASLIAAKTLMSYLVENEDELYPYLAEQGARTREILESAFATEGILARCTGQGNEAVPGSSMFLLHFPLSSDDELKGPGDWLDPAVCDVTLSHQVCSLAFLLEDLFLSRGRGAVSAAHGDSELDFLEAAAGRVARLIKQSL